MLCANIFSEYPYLQDQLGSNSYLSYPPPSGYWILSIDGKDNNICLFNLYEHLDYTNTNLGTGQVMLSESKFYPYFKGFILFFYSDIGDWLAGCVL